MASQEPEMEPLRFPIDTTNQPYETEAVMRKIKELAENKLYHWKKFPLVLPPSISNIMSADGDQNQPLINFNDLFVTPNFDELDQVALDKDGKNKNLSDEQLESIRKTGQFEVDSLSFPGQVHVWQLSHLLQKGSDKSKSSLLNDFALATRILVITARNRLISHFFSVSQALKSVGKGCWQILDILIGMPRNSAGNMMRKLHEEHTNYLVAEFNIKSSYRRDWQYFCDFVKEKTKLLESEKEELRDIIPPLMPYKFQTPKGVDIDLRLFNKDIMEKCNNILKNILEREARGWHIRFKDRMLADLKDLNLSHNEIVRKVNQAILEEYTRRVYDSILHNEDLEAVQPQIGELLVNHAKAYDLMVQATVAVHTKMLEHRDKLKAHLKKTYPVRSRINAWMNEQLSAFECEFVRQHEWAAHEKAIDMCQEEGLSQAVYFLQRDLTFRRDRSAVLRKELGRVKIPRHVFSYATRIWLPSNWIIERHQNGEVEVIPTIIVDSSRVTASIKTGYDEPSFTVEKNIYRRTSTRYPFWRWMNYLLRTFSWTLNAMFYFGVVIPWCSAVSLRALFYIKPFMVDFKLSQVNGTLSPDPDSLTQTMSSRLDRLWSHVRLSRDLFENAPDQGFLGKSFTRYMNRFWNYVIKGALGSILIVLVNPLLCILVSLLSFIIAITAFLWMPVVTLILHLLLVIFYDYQCPDDSNAILYLFEATIFRIFILGFLQPVAALIFAFVFCPIASGLITLGGVVRFGLRATWDSIMFHGIIRKRGRVPAGDGFIARRVAGPGLASNYFYQIRPEQALAATEARMELHELNAWADHLHGLIEKPTENFRKFIRTIFGPFSGVLGIVGVYESLLSETQKLHSLLSKEVDKRTDKLTTGLSTDVQSRIKLTSRELKVTVTQTAKLLAQFYPSHVLRRLPITEEEFWEQKNLEQNDWQGLATHLLSEVFSSSFLTPLEETDTCFRLEVIHVNLSRYISMLKSAEFQDDLDVVSAVHTPKGDIDVEPPRIDVTIFNPAINSTKSYTKTLAYRVSCVDQPKVRRPWKRPLEMFTGLHSMEIPLPVPHPAVISLLVYNRDNDHDQIDMDDLFCQRLIEAGEKVAYSELQDASRVDLYESNGAEMSTPDHTTNSEPDVVPSSYLAEPESVSDPSSPEHEVLKSSSSTTSPESDNTGVGQAETLPLHGRFYRTQASVEGAVLYTEAEADTSCVISVVEDTATGEEYVNIEEPQEGSTNV